MRTKQQLHGRRALYSSAKVAYLMTPLPPMTAPLMLSGNSSPLIGKMEARSEDHRWRRRSEY